MMFDMIRYLFDLIRDFIWPTPISGIINLVNIILLFCAVNLGWGQLKRYKKVELDSILTIRKRVIDWLEGFKKLNAPNESDPKDIPNLMINTEELIADVNKDSLIVKRIRVINSLKRHRARVNIGALQQTTIADETSNPGVRLPATTANIAIMLGLFGTFIGLFEMVRSISFLMNGSSGKLTEVSSILNVLQDMEVIFKGIRMAFSTSIVGMFSAIICFYLSASIRRHQQKVLVALDTFTNQELLTVTVPTIEDQHLLEIVANEIRESFHRLDSVITKNTTVLKELNVIEETFQQIVTDIRNITQREESKNVDTIIGQITQTNQAISQITAHLPEMLRSTKQYGESVAKKVDTTLEKLQITEAKTRNFDAMLGEVAQTNKALSLFVTNLPEMLRTMRLCTESISQKADIVSKVAAGTYPPKQERGLWDNIKKFFS
jgi:biopolymer transport protein ExbB/TolQ